MKKISLLLGAVALIGFTYSSVATASTLEEVHKAEIDERSEEELLEEEIRNQQTLDSFVESDKKWS